MRVIIVGHHSRAKWIDQLMKHLPEAIATVDYKGTNSFVGHAQALKIANECEERCVIMEDDAIPVVGFEEKAKLWFDRLPDSLISFYLGTGRPITYQSIIDQSIERTPVDYIVLDRLIHAVCYSVPKHRLGQVIERLDPVETQADWAVGRAWHNAVVYPVESLVEHRDDGMVEPRERYDSRTERRVARHLAGPLMYRGDK